MRDFLDALDERLSCLAAVAPPEPARIRERLVPAAAATQPRRRWLPVAGLALSAAAVGAVLLATAPLAQTASGLPILKVDPVDRATVLAQVQLPDEVLDLRHVRPVPSATGTAFAVPSGTGRICLIAPDPEALASFGTACGSTATVQAAGLILEAVGDLSRNPRATSTITMILPLATTGVRVETEGRSFAPPVVAGTTSFTLTAPGTLRYTTKGTPLQQSFQGPFAKSTAFQLDCPSGPRSFATTPPMITRPGQLPAPDFERACR